MKMSVLIVMLLCLVIMGCGFRTYRPNQLYSTDAGADGCVVTKLDGIVDSGKVTLVQPDGKYFSESTAIKYGYTILPMGSKINLISLSSGWDSIVGRYIKAKARVPNLGDKPYDFRIYYVISGVPDKADFETFLEKGFVPCK